MPLLYILRSSPKIVRSATKVAIDTGSVHNPSGKCVNEVKPIGRVARLQSPGLIAQVKDNTLYTDKSAKDWRLVISAILTKYPHYEFVCKVKSGELNKIKYWFKDTKANEGKGITRVMSYKDMLQELRRARVSPIRTKEEGFEPTYIEPEDYIPKYCIVPTLDMDNIRKMQYDTYKIRKYNTLTPFVTGIEFVYREKFDYTNAGMSI